MFGSAPLDALIGLVLIFASLSVVCSAMVERVAAWRKWRATLLNDTVKLLLGEEGAKKFFDRASIKPLCTNKIDVGNRPSYLPGSVFAEAVTHMISEKSGGMFASIRQNLGTSSIEMSVAPFVRAAGQAVPDDAADVDKARLDNLGNLLATWYGQAMDRATGQYKRYVQFWLLICGLSIATIANIDAIEITRYFLNNPAAREAVVKRATELTMPTTRPADPALNGQTSIDAVRVTAPLLAEYGFPLGWQTFHGPAGRLQGNWWGWILVVLLKFAGIASTGFAVSLGAPFWFDVMNKLASLRAAGASGEASAKPKEPTPKESTSASSPVVSPAAASAPSVLPGFWNEPARAEDNKTFDPKAEALSLPNAEFLAKSALLAYSSPDAVGRMLGEWKMTQVTCPQGKSTQLFVAEDETKLLVSFRGTEVTQLQDILADARIALRPWGGFPGRIHHGFASALDEVFAELEKRVDESLKGRPLWVTGHSLGGALATLYVSYRALNKKPVQGVYTFGCPRVGDSVFCDAVRATPVRFYRLVNDKDIVTRVASRLMHYEHIGSTCYITRDGRLEVDGPEWVRYLNTLLDAMTQFQKLAAESFKDHSMELYVSRISRLTLPNA